MKKIVIPQNLLALAANCRSPLYAVGGFVRNSLAGLPLSDIDLSGPVQANALDIDPHYKVKIVNQKLGTAVISDGNSHFEYTPFRIENYPRGGAHTPTSVYFTGDISVDAARRDFCANAVYYDLEKNEIIDFFGGVRDIENRVFREIPYPAKVFSSDGLRILRLVRLAAETGFDIDKDTAMNAKRFSGHLRDISKERIAGELNRLLTADIKYGVQYAHYRGMKLMGALGLWRYVIPQIEDMMGVEQNPQFHKYDCYEHTMQTVKYAPISVRLAALLHDIGKPVGMKKDGNMHAHCAYGEKITKNALGIRGLKYSNAEVADTAWLVKNHMYDLDGLTSDSKVRLFVAENFDKIDRLVMLIKADIKGAGMKEPPLKHRFEAVKADIIAQGVPTRLSDLNISGQDAVECGIKSANIGTALSALFRECVFNPKLNNREWLIAQLQKAAEREEVKNNTEE